MTATAEKAPETEADGKKSGRRKKLIVILVVAVLAIAGAAYWFLLKPGGGETPPAEPGEILPLESTQINLADGHYLSLGLALQLTTEAQEADGSKALDAAIGLFSGRELRAVEGRQRVRLKERLVEQLEHLYDGDVMDVYFTEFVTQ